MTSLLIIALLGVALARLNRDRSAGDEPWTAVPEDLWAEFEHVTGLGRVSLVARTTVGALHSGAAGWVTSAAARQDTIGDLWLDAAAVVHPERTAERILVRRDDAGYHLQRHRTVVELPAGQPAAATRACVKVDSLFD